MKQIIEKKNGNNYKYQNLLQVIGLDFSECGPVIYLGKGKAISIL